MLRHIDCFVDVKPILNSHSVSVFYCLLTVSSWFAGTLLSITALMPLGVYSFFYLFGFDNREKMSLEVSLQLLFPGRVSEGLVLTESLVEFGSEATWP